MENHTTSKVVFYNGQEKGVVYGNDFPFLCNTSQVLVKY